MKPAATFILGALAGVVAAIALPRLVRHDAPRADAGAPAPATPVHEVSRFEFTLQAPLDAVFPLFGPEREKAWAPGWAPEFVYPRPPADVPGAVFTITHGPLRSTWINTAFDHDAGRVQYAYVVPGVLATLITLHVTPAGEKATHVTVEYARTALSEASAAHVREMAAQDRAAGPEWEKQITAFLQRP